MGSASGHHAQAVCCRPSQQTLALPQEQPPLKELAEHRKTACADNFHDQYQLGKMLGKGAFGQVRLARKADEKKVVVAVKIVDVRGDGPKRSTASDALREVSMCQKLGQSSHVVCLIEAFIEADLAYLVMEKCEASLLSMLERAPLVTEQSLAQVFRGMLLGIVHVHSCRLVHRDIKPDNFIGGIGDLTTLKLCDFGLTQELPPQGYLEGVRGTPPFMCPEMLIAKRYNAGADVWSFAVCMYVLMFGEFPNNPKERSAQGMKRAIAYNDPKPPYALNARLGSYAAKPSEKMVSCIQSLLCRDMLERPTAAQALQMPMIVDATGRIPEGPSFRPTLLRAKREGAFDPRTIHVDDGDGVDTLLQELQSKHQGSRMTRQHGDSASAKGSHGRIPTKGSGTDDASTEAGSCASESDAPSDF